MPRELRVSLSAICLLLFASAKAADQKQSSLRLRDIDQTDTYEVLDRWRETIGHGRQARRYHVRKIRAPATGETKTVRFDDRGAVVDLSTAKTRRRPRQKISERLRKKWDHEPKQRLQVIVWIVDPESRSRHISERLLRAAPVKREMELAANVLRPAGERADLAKRNADLAELRQRVAAANLLIINALLVDAKIAARDVIYKYSQAPAAALHLTQEQAQQLAQRADVRFIFDDPTTSDELPFNVPAVLAPPIWTQGFTGTGVIVAVVGESGPVVMSNPYLTATLRNPTAAPSAHATRVAGIVGSLHPTIQGVAPDVTLLSASRSGSATSSSVDAAADWALLNSATILSASQRYDNTFNGKLNWSDIYFDYLIHNSRVLFVKSGGNEGNGNFVTSPGRGYNSLAVGNIDDRGNWAWSDDIMHFTSSSLNSETGTDKPEIAAYGTRVRSTIWTYPWIHSGSGETGTSYSAPLVAGIAALCVNRHPALSDEPQALKAMIMASGAAHNIEGDPRLSDLDGAGAALATASRTGFHAESLEASDFGFDGRYEIDADIPLTTGDPLRVVMVYTHPPDSEGATPSLSSYQRSDLDLELYVNGVLAAESHYGDRNPFEIIDFTPSTDAVARVKVHAQSWHPSVGVLRVGLAYASASTLGTSP